MEVDAGPGWGCFTVRCLEGMLLPSSGSKPAVLPCHRTWEGHCSLLWNEAAATRGAMG